MRSLLWASLLLGLAGCGGGGHEAITNPADLPPLTAADHEEIRQRDEDVNQAERGQPPVTTGKRR